MDGTAVSKVGTGRVFQILLVSTMSTSPHAVRLINLVYSFRSCGGVQDWFVRIP